MSLCLEVIKASTIATAGVANDGYWGFPIQPDTRYRASFFAKAAPGFDGPVTVSLQSEDGTTIYATAQITGLTGEWKSFEATLQTVTVTPTTKARFALTLDRPGKVWLGLVSLFPPTWKDQPNGFRKDLMQMLVDMKPQFLRFPGGNYVEGDTIDTRFDWKKTIGPIAQRQGHRGPWGYRSTDGMGLLEFLMWCEDMNAEPVLAVYGGYSLKGAHVEPGTALEPFVQDALDEIEYVSGDAKTTWGARRAKDGHPEPFKLTHVEINNEDFFDKSGSYDQRFAQFYDAIKAKYPQLKIISTVGYEQPAAKQVHSRTPDLVDEHYYRAADEFLKDSPWHYEKYERKGQEIFVGEWASYEDPNIKPWSRPARSQTPTPSMKAALGDAAWMIAMERNADLIVMQCYAPLLVNTNPGARQWRPDLIGYDGLHVFGSPSYYAIQLFNQNMGDELLRVSRSHTQVQASATRDSASGAIIVKLVNAESKEAPLTFEISGVTSVDPAATAITLAADPDDTNSLAEPTKVVPATSAVSDVKASFTWSVPAHAIVVLKLQTH